MMWQDFERLGLSVCGLRNLDEGMNFFDCLLGHFLIIFWMFSKIHTWIEWDQIPLWKNWLVEQLIIMIWKKFCQMDLLVFSWKEGFWKKFWSLWRNKKRVFRKRLLRRPNAPSAKAFWKWIEMTWGPNAPSWKIYIFF